MSNVKYFPFSQMADLDLLDETEMVAGYRAGTDGQELPGECTRSFWHGWRNGCADSGRLEHDESMSRLAKAFCDKGEL